MFAPATLIIPPPPVKDKTPKGAGTSCDTTVPLQSNPSDASPDRAAGPLPRSVPPKSAFHESLFGSGAGNLPPRAIFTPPVTIVVSDAPKVEVPPAAGISGIILVLLSS